MIVLDKVDVLFDDLKILENILGEDASKISSANTDCDCIDYTQTFDDGDFNTQESS